MSTIQVDVAVIGGGPGGYVAAIRCAQLGMQVALIERYRSLGGTCTHVGCIPSKALLDSSELYHAAAKGFASHGIRAEGLAFDWGVMRARKDKVVQTTAAGIDKLIEKNGIRRLYGHGRLDGPGRVMVALGEGGEQPVEARQIVLATGSKPTALPFAPFDKQRIISSTELLALPALPASLLVVGAGIIGLELGSVCARLGSKVTVIEALDRAVPTMDGEVGKELERSLKRLGFKFHFGARVQAIEAREGGVHLSATDAKGRELGLEAERCLVAVGRRPYSEGLGLETVGLATDRRGFVETDERLRTVAEGVWAIGDLIGGAMLAHKAEEEGVFVAEAIAGQRPHIHYRSIPGVVYTWPEAASTGWTEEELKAQGRAYKVGRYPMIALGRARAAGEKEGFVKILAAEADDEILGVHIVGPRAADLIAEAVVALEYRASAEDLARICHAHPTYAEAVKEAALDASAGRPLHL
jgi:dihydrolipoamide dehydrogenase